MKLDLFETQNNCALLGAGVFDGMSAKLAEQAGFDVLWLSSFAVSCSYGLPDINMITVSEMTNRCSMIAAVCPLPIIVDMDNGYGTTANSVRGAVALHLAGATAICIEDAVFPKRCSFYDQVDRALEDDKQFSRRIAAIKARVPDLTLIARTEALVAGLGVEEAVRRAALYRGSGADAIMVQFPNGSHDALRDLVRMMDVQNIPLVITPTGLSDVSALELEALGVRIVIHANAAVRAATKSIGQVLKTLAARETSLAQVSGGICSMSDIESLTRARDWLALDGAVHD